MDDKVLVLLIILLILVIFSFDYQARLNRNSIRIFFEDYEFRKSQIKRLSEKAIELAKIKNVVFILNKEQELDYTYYRGF